MSERSTWVEVAPAALEANLRAVTAHADVPVCAVVKANGYGHDAVIAARAFVRAGAHMLAVTRIEEARALRDAGIEVPILLLMPTPDPGEAVKIGCEVTVGSVEEVASLPAEASVHLKVDTGMGRLGVRPEAARAAADAIAARATLAGVWTHFADAAGSSGRIQVERFAEVIATLRRADMLFVAHAANSAAVITRPDARFDMVRVGTVLYGLDPPGARAPWEKREALRWFARVAAVRELPAGATVGYGLEWTAKRPTRVATLPIGYADGFTLEPRARTETTAETAKGIARAVRTAVRRDTSPRAVFFGDRRAPVVGRVAMQATTVSLEDLPDVEVGSVARIPARRLTINPLIERVEADPA